MTKMTSDISESKNNFPTSYDGLCDIFGHPRPIENHDDYESALSIYEKFMVYTQETLNNIEQEKYLVELVDFIESYEEKIISRNDIFICGLAYIGAGFLLGELNNERYFPMPGETNEKFSKDEAKLLDIMKELKAKLPKDFNSSYTYFSKIIDSCERKSKEAS